MSDAEGPSGQISRQVLAGAQPPLAARRRALVGNCGPMRIGEFLAGLRRGNARDAVWVTKGLADWTGRIPARPTRSHATCQRPQDHGLMFAVVSNDVADTTNVDWLGYPTRPTCYAMITRHKFTTCNQALEEISVDARQTSGWPNLDEAGPYIGKSQTLIL